MQRKIRGLALWCDSKIKNSENRWYKHKLDKIFFDLITCETTRQLTDQLDMLLAESANRQLIMVIMSGKMGKKLLPDFKIKYNGRITGAIIFCWDKERYQEWPRKYGSFISGVVNTYEHLEKLLIKKMTLYRESDDTEIEEEDANDQSSVSDIDKKPTLKVEVKIIGHISKFQTI